MLNSRAVCGDSCSAQRERIRSGRPRLPGDLEAAVAVDIEYLLGVIHTGPQSEVSDEGCLNIGPENMVTRRRMRGK